jgi:hypothetical protein
MLEDGCAIMRRKREITEQWCTLRPTKIVRFDRLSWNGLAKCLKRLGKMTNLMKHDKCLSTKPVMPKGQQVFENKRFLAGMTGRPPLPIKTKFGGVYACHVTEKGNEIR